MKNEKPEIILKQRYLVEVTTTGDQVVPEILLLANRAGFQYLAEYFSEFARKEIPATLLACGDPDDHDHITRQTEAVNATFSDRMEIRVGLLTEESKKQEFEKYAITEGNRSDDDLITQYTHIITSAQATLARLSEIDSAQHDGEAEGKHSP